LFGLLCGEKLIGDNPELTQRLLLSLRQSTEDSHWKFDVHQLVVFLHPYAHCHVTSKLLPSTDQEVSMQTVPCRVVLPDTFVIFRS
jgi:hypothetical protein